jgi:hypothetical protein
MIRKSTFLFAGMLIFGISAFSQFRKYSNEFLNIGAGARALAMGGAQSSSVSDATSGYWNPAALSSVTNNTTASLMHADYFAGIAKYDYAAVALPAKDNKRTIGFSLLRFAVDDIPNTLFLVEPDGSLNYNNISSFSSADYAFLMSFGQLLRSDDKKTISFGGNAKIIHRKVGTFAKAWGFGVDAAVLIKSKNWSASVVAKDVTSTFNAWSFSFTDREKEALYLSQNEIPVRSTEMTAPRLSLGGCYRFVINDKINLQPEANLDLTFDGKRNTLIASKAVSIDPRVGLEAGYKGMLFVRAGINNFQRALADADTLNQKKVWIYQPSLGAGFVVKNVTIDYAFTNLANQENPLYTHVFSLKLNFVKKQEQ